MPRQDSSRNSRNIHSGNYLSKKRCQQPSQPVNKLKKVCASSNHQSFNAPIYNDRHNYGTVIIIAGASTEIERVAKSSERRFTIPNVKGNYNIAIQQFENSHGYLSKALRELQIEFKVRKLSMSSDIEDTELLLID